MCIHCVDSFKHEIFSDYYRENMKIKISFNTLGDTYDNEYY